MPDDDRIRVPGALWPTFRRLLGEPGNEPFISPETAAQLPALIEAELAALARAWRPTRPALREAHWRRYIDQYFGIAIDGDALTLAGTAMKMGRASSIRVVHGYLGALARMDAGVPDPTALIRAFGQHGRWEEHLDALRLAKRAEELRQAMAALQADVTCFLATLPPPDPEPPRAREDRTAAAAVVRDVLAPLRRRGAPPLWRAIAAVLWFHGWDVDPRRPHEVATLKSEYFRWRREVP